MLPIATVTVVTGITPASPVLVNSDAFAIMTVVIDLTVTVTTLKERISLCVPRELSGVIDGMLVGILHSCL